MFFIYYVWFFFRFFYNFFIYILEKLNLSKFFQFYVFRNIEEVEKLVNFLKVVFNTSSQFYLKIYKLSPTFFFLKLYFNKSNYNNTNLRFLVKQFKYYNNILKIKNYNFLNLNFSGLNNYFFLLFLIFQRFFIVKYYNLYTFLFFNNNNLNNLVKLNWVFFKSLSSFKQFLLLDIDKINDFYKINFSKSIFIRNFKKIKTNFWVIKEYNKLKKNKYLYFLKIYNIYNLNYSNKNLKKFLKLKYKNIFLLSFNNFYLFKFKLNNKFKLPGFLNLYPIRFSESSLNKYIDFKNLNCYNFFFLRKNRIFNKSRYSRNRQLYRTGVYWCLWLNIIIVYGLFFLFYRFTFNFGYVWFGFFILMLSFIFSKVIKYNFINLKVLFKEFIDLVKWFSLLYLNFLNFLKIIFKKYLFKLNLINHLWNFINLNIINNFFFIQRNFISIRLIKNIINFFNKLDLVCFTILWQEMHEKDVSFLRYKTILHFFTQLTQIHKMV